MTDHDSIVRVGVDLAQSVVQVHVVDAAGNVVVARQFQRSGLIPWCERLPEGDASSRSRRALPPITWLGN